MRRLEMRRYLSFLLLSIFSTAVSAAEHDAATWLERMINAAHQLNYTGTFVYRQDGSLQSMKIIHAVNENGESERLISLSGPSREVIRNRERVTCILPEDSSIVMEHAGTPPPFPVELPRDLKPLREFYDIRLGGEERIAGMMARKVVIAPRDQFRYGQNFWLDEESGLLLRADVVNESGEIVEQVMFTSLEIHDAIPESQLKPEISGDSKVLQLERQSRDGKMAVTQPGGNWQVLELPPGFSQQLQRSYFLPEKHSPVEHHVYSDGLASVSVFIEKRSESNNNLSGASAMGGVNAYGRAFGDYVVTVMGEVPPLTVKRIAESLQQGQP